MFAHSFTYASSGTLMKRIIHILLLLLGYFSISACTNLGTKQENHNDITQWDFDHHVHFTQTHLAENYFQLKIIPTNKVGFELLATFLLRQSYSLCQHYHYKLEIIQGIEGFDDKRAMPNYIHPSLIAKVECQPKILSAI
jgi:hypothetical protein